MPRKHVIWKHPLPWPSATGKTFTLSVPILMKSLLGIQDGVPMLWAKHDTGYLELITRQFMWVATGQEFDGVYLGSIQEKEFVWHLIDLDGGGTSSA